jgi:hypothetical protein
MVRVRVSVDSTLAGDIKSPFMVTTEEGKRERERERER